MNSRSKSIVLIDRPLMITSDWAPMVNSSRSELVILDPFQLISEIDWTLAGNEANVVNKIYSRLFDEVVVCNKKLVCFWPLSDQFGSEWVDLASLCKANTYELEIFKSTLFDRDNYGFSDEELRAWKKFVYLIIESLLSDIQLNEGLEEIAALTSNQNSIILFRLEQNGKFRYSFAFDSYNSSVTSIQKESFPNPIIQPPFDSFKEMLEELLEKNDLSLYQTKFFNLQHEKAYFSVLAGDFKTRNLIETWIECYSLN